MQKKDGGLIVSASDLVHFLECRYRTILDLRDLNDPMEKVEGDLEQALLQEKGIEHEAAYLESLRKGGFRVADMTLATGDSLKEKAVATLQAMKSGDDIIYQATLMNGHWLGYADFLRRVERPSALGAYSYEAIDTKLAGHAKPKFLIQLCVYSDLLENAQGVEPREMHLVLGDGAKQNFRVVEFAHYYRTAKQRFENFVAAPAESYPEPCELCQFCHWRDRCQDQWLADDHLSQVANIRRDQIRKLNEIGMGTMKSLSEMTPANRVPGIGAETLQRLCRQAALQVSARETGKRRYELLIQPVDEIRGFARLPRPDSNDLFFDMEGDPLYPEGLEYLFGLYYRQDGKTVFRPFWAHTHAEEREAFEAFMDFVIEWLKNYPHAHIYHYGSYEETALKRLMSRYSTRENAVDNLLRHRRLVDLYKVVREAIMISEPAYSLKNVEHFYMEAREAELKTAAGSIVYYEQWRQTGDQKLLDDIQRYNEDDCRSTCLLRDWLLQNRLGTIPWFKEGVETKSPDSSNEMDKLFQSYEGRLLAGFPGDPLDLTDEQRFRQQVYYLLNFHRREEKPQWWAFFARQEMTVDELMEDGECLGNLTLVGQEPASGRSSLYSFSFPAQESKFRSGDDCHLARTGSRLGTIEGLDLDGRQVVLKISSKTAVDRNLSLIPAGPLSSKILQNAVFRFADSVIADSGDYRALKSLLRREPPSITGHAQGAPIADGDALDRVIEAVLAMQQSYLFIQGPPGSGKTYTGSHIVVRLIEEGYKVGVTSNSHKAINNLLRAIEEVAVAKGLNLNGVKKSTENVPESCINGRMIRDVFSKNEVDPKNLDLVAGTAWLFADPEFDQAVDYLVIDEAGQVSLGHLVAMGTAARNILLLGDHMQLSQPIQGIHPGRSGESVLEYLLDGEAVIPDDRGIFLPTTRRMHEAVCRFVSDAVYDGRLHPHPDNNRQQIVLDESAHPALEPARIRYINVEHEGRSQRCPEEAEIVRSIFESLLQQHYIDRDGNRYAMNLENILVISPYNMQVNLLTSLLPQGARVGTVDKFQGQQAEAVIVSMATSGAEDMPRNIEFLYSKNRLNVAVSRARSLVIIVASSKLLHIPCKTVEQMQLVNTLCWLKSYAME